MMSLNKNKTLENIDLRLRCPFTMLISGPSSSGKTTFTRRLLERRGDKFDKSSPKVYWFYKVYQDIYEKMKQENVVDEFIEGIPSMSWIDENIAEKNCTIVIDDMALEVTEDTAKIFSVGSHHFHLNVILLCQNLFTKNKAFREISLNSTYHIIFKNPRDKSSIVNFAKQFSPGRTKDLARIFQDATEKPHSYLFIDYHQSTKDENRILANILFEGANPIVVYRLNK
jgi:GTPase SAR1 family protein